MNPNVSLSLTLNLMQVTPIGQSLRKTRAIKSILSQHERPKFFLESPQAMTVPAIMIVSAKVIPGKEDEFNEWYDKHHIPLFSGRFPKLKVVRRFYSEKANPQFIAIYEFDSKEDLEKALASEELKAAREDSGKQKGVLAETFSSNTYLQIFPFN